MPQPTFASMTGVQCICEYLLRSSDRSIRPRRPSIITLAVPDFFFRTVRVKLNVSPTNPYLDEHVLCPSSKLRVVWLAAPSGWVGWVHSHRHALFRYRVFRDALRKYHFASRGEPRVIDVAGEPAADKSTTGAWSLRVDQTTATGGRVLAPSVDRLTQFGDMRQLAAKQTAATLSRCFSHLSPQSLLAA